MHSRVEGQSWLSERREQKCNRKSELNIRLPFRRAVQEEGQLAPTDRSGARGSSFAKSTSMAGHAGVSVNSQLTLRVDYLMRPISIVERTAIGTARRSLE